MEDWQYRILIQSFAVNAEIEGMKAENQQRMACGNSVAYDEQNFIDKASELERLARELVC